MIFGVHKLVRNAVLGLMFMLAVTATCLCDSYDPDPYDDVPPVVTVEFNYVVPYQANILRPGAQVRSPQLSKWERGLRMIAPSVLAMFESSSVPAMSKGSPPLAAPLRC